MQQNTDLSGNTQLDIQAVEIRNFGHSDRRSNYLRIGFKSTDYIVIGTVLLLLSGGIYLKLTNGIV